MQFCQTFQTHYKIPLVCIVYQVYSVERWLLSSAEGDEVFWVGLVIVEDHKHGGLLLVVHHTVEAVGGVWGSRRGAYRGLITDCVTAGQDTGNIQPLQARRVWRGISSCWIICVDCEVNSPPIRSSCDRDIQGRRQVSLKEHFKHINILGED